MRPFINSIISIDNLTKLFTAQAEIINPMEAGKNISLRTVGQKPFLDAAKPD